MSQPFERDELMARVNAPVRRGTRTLLGNIEIGKLFLDASARKARYNNADLDLGATEFHLLEFLMRNCGCAFTRTQLLEHPWEYDFDRSPNIVDVYVSRLRRKLKLHGGEHIVTTVWGGGYRLER